MQSFSAFSNFAVKGYDLRIDILKIFGGGIR
jgi:hypothetical protein